MTAWYALRTAPHAEFGIARAAAERGFEPLLPMERRITIARSERRLVERPFFLGYLFVRCPATPEAWHALRHIRGVAHLMPTHRQVPVPLPPEALEALRELHAHFATLTLENASRRAAAGFRDGQQVRALRGPFAGFLGTVDKAMPERIRVLHAIFGRATPVEYEAADVEAAD